MADEYRSQTQDIAEPMDSGTEARSAVIAVFDEWFWEDCLLTGTRADKLNQIVATPAEAPQSRRCCSNAVQLCVMAKLHRVFKRLRLT